MKDTLRKLALLTLTVCLSLPALAAYNSRTVTLKAQSESMAANGEDFAGDIVVPENEKVTFRITHNGSAGIYDKVEITVAKKNDLGNEVECFHHAETAVDSSAMPTFEWDTGSADPELSDSTSGPVPTPGAYTAYAKLYKEGTDPLKYTRTTTQCKVHLGPKLEITEGPEYLFANATFWTTIKYRVFTGDTTALAVTDLNLDDPNLIDGTDDLKILDQYVTKQVGEETDDDGNLWTLFETYINAECYSSITLTNEFSKSAKIELTALGDTVEDTWEINTFVDSTVAAVDIHEDATFCELQNATFFVGEGRHTWKLLREGCDFPIGSPNSVTGPNWKLYHPYYEVRHNTEELAIYTYVWDGKDYPAGPQYSDYVDTTGYLTFEYVAGSPVEDFFKNSSIDSGYDGQLHAKVKMMQTGEKDDYGEFLGAADDIMCGLRFGISYGGQEKTIEGETFTAMDYEKDQAASCSVDGFRYVVTIDNTQPIESNDSLSFDEFLWKSVLAIAAAVTIPETWPAWVSAGLLVGGDGVWQLIKATASADIGKAGRAHSMGWGLKLEGDLAALSADANSVFNCLGPETIEPFFRDSTSPAYGLDYGFPTTEINTGRIIGVANQVAARVQLQSRDTHFGTADVFGEAKVTISNFTSYDGSSSDPGTVRVKCVQ